MGHEAMFKARLFHLNRIMPMRSCILTRIGLHQYLPDPSVHVRDIPSGASAEACDLGGCR